MKDRIENEVLRADELERNVKLGRGGIREIEFIVQAQQLLHAGRQPFLQGAQTLPCLEKLAQYNLLSDAEARALRGRLLFSARRGAPAADGGESADAHDSRESRPPGNGWRN